MKYQIMDYQLNQLFSDGDKFNTIEEAVDRLTDFFSIDYTEKELIEIANQLTQLKPFSELKIIEEVEE